MCYIPISTILRAAIDIFFEPTLALAACRSIFSVIARRFISSLYGYMLPLLPLSSHQNNFCVTYLVLIFMLKYHKLTSRNALFLLR